MSFNFSHKTEDSEELRALALRFSSFEDKWQLAKTEKFMQLSSSLKAIQDHVDEMLKIMQSGKPFSSLEVEDKKFGISSYEPPVEAARIMLNEYSMESIFREVLRAAFRAADWGRKNSFRKMPHAEALAWITYFSKYDETKDAYVMNDNWISYYKTHFPVSKHN